LILQNLIEFADVM